MEKILSIVLIVVCILLIGSVLIQGRGTGLSATFGGEGNVYRSKRGAEKIISNGTVVLVVLFVIISLLIPLWSKITLILA